MKRWIVTALSVCVMAVCCGAGAGESDKPAEQKGVEEKMPVQKANPVVIVETSMGTIKAELWPDKASVTVENFLKYADDKFYDGLIFHRVMKGFMIQGGGFTPEMRQKQTRTPIKNEARADVPNQRGTLAMARTSNPDSATAQFFINHKDNSMGLDKGKCRDGFGYCVFGKVTEGMDVVDKIAEVKTGIVAGFENVPLEPVTIKSIRRDQ